MTDLPKPALAEQSFRLGDTVTVIAQYDVPVLLDGSMLDVDQFLTIAAQRFKRVLRKELCEETA